MVSNGLELVEADLPLGALPPGTSNRVVYAEELGALREGLRRYHFRVASSPVELAADAIWQQFLATFDRTSVLAHHARMAAGKERSPGAEPPPGLRYRPESLEVLFREATS